MPTPQEVQRAEQRRQLEAQRRLPTPAISPLPLPNINTDAFRRLREATAGSPGAVNVAGQPTPERFADPRRGRGTGVTRPTPLSSVSPPGGILSTTQLPSEFFQASQPAQGLLESGQRPSEFFGVAPPPITTPQSPFALNAGEFHRVMQWTSGRILQAVNEGSRNFLPGQITDVIATLLPWRDWGFGSYQEALRALGYTEIPGAGTWIKDEEILSTAGAAGGGTSTQFVTQRANFGGGGGGGFRSPQFSTLINWRI